jgi:Flp pilus assembly protein TadG
MFNHSKSSFAVREKASRRGTAMVEMAISMPLLMLLSFGAIEFANLIFLRQTVAQISYEGARIASLPLSSKDDVRRTCEQLLAGRRITDGNVTVSPDNLSATTPAGTRITITVTIPASANAITPKWFFKTASLTKRTIMVRI